MNARTGDKRDRQRIERVSIIVCQGRRDVENTARRIGVVGSETSEAQVLGKSRIDHRSITPVDQNRVGSQKTVIGEQTVQHDQIADTGIADGHRVG